MVHGTPDWGLKKKSTVYALDDMAELAARLGSIVTFDRRGDVIFLDDFEAAAIKWDTVAAGAGALVGLVTARARNGNQSLRIYPSTTANQYSYAKRLVPYPAATKVGFEASFCVPLNVTNMRGYFPIFRSPDEYRAGWTLNTNTGELSLYDKDGNWTVVETVSTELYTDWLFRTAKLVADVENARYERFILDSQTFLLTEHPLWTGATTSWGYIEVQLKAATNLAGSTQSVWFDDFILTQNEP